MPKTNSPSPTDAAAPVTTRGPSPYKLVRVEKISAPNGSSGQNWYRYVLESGMSTISGQRCGSLKEVTAHATQYAETLNARGIGGHSAWSPRAKKAT